METRLLCLLHALRFGSYTVNQLCVCYMLFARLILLLAALPPPHMCMQATFSLFPDLPPPLQEGRFVEKSGGIFVITISLTIVGTGLLTTSTHHTPTDLFITLPILLKPSKQLQRLHFSDIYYQLCTIFFGNWTPFWDLLCTLCMGACNVYLPLSSVACDIKHVRIHGKWHSITSNLWFKRFKPCEAWFKRVCSAVGHSSDNGFWHTVLFFKDT